MHRTYAKRLARPLATVALAGGLLAPLATLGPLPDAAEAQTAPKPNIIVMIADDLDTKAMESGEDPRVRYNNIFDKIRAQGVELTNAHTVSPLCCPNRAAFLTGRYVHNHGVDENPLGYDKYVGLPLSFPPGGERPLQTANSGQPNSRPANWETADISRGMQNAGYKTVYTGKYLNGYSSQKASGLIPPGWNRWSVFDDADEQYYNYVLFEGSNDANGTQVTGARTPTFGVARTQDTDPPLGVDAPAGPNPSFRNYSTDNLRDRFLAYIDPLLGREPVFAVFSPYGPHSVDAPPGNPNVGTGSVFDRFNSQQDGTCTPAPRHTSDAQQPLSDLNRPVRRGPNNEPDINENLADKKNPFLDMRPLIDDPDPTVQDDIFEINQRHRRRVRCMRSVDDAVGAIVDKVAEKGQLANTYFFFVSDNGVQFGEQNQGQRSTVSGNMIRESSKAQPYDTSTRIPLYIRGPQVTARGPIDVLVRAHDLFSTWLQIGGATALKAGDGRPLQPLFDGAAPDGSDWARKILLVEDRYPTDFDAVIHRNGARFAAFFRFLAGEEANRPIINDVNGPHEEEYYRPDDKRTNVRNVAADPSLADALRWIRMDHMRLSDCTYDKAGTPDGGSVRCSAAENGSMMPLPSDYP